MQIRHLQELAPSRRFHRIPDRLCHCARVRRDGVRLAVHLRLDDDDRRAVVRLEDRLPNPVVVAVNVDDVIAGRLCAPFGFGLSHQRKYYVCSAARPDPGDVPAAFIEWLLQEGRDTEQSILALGQAMSRPESPQL